MRVFLLLLILALPVFALPQLTDTTCIKYRWIAVKKLEPNTPIFQLNSELDTLSDLVFVIKRLVEEHKLTVYTTEASPYGIKGWYELGECTERENIIREVTSSSHTDVFTISQQSDVPLVDEYGEPIIQSLPDGTNVYVYPPPTVYVFPTRMCDEIKIKEERTYDPVTKTFSFVPVAFSLYFKGNEYWHGHEKFWVDIKELSHAIGNSNSFPWYNAIINRRYLGFQYMQVSCWDEEIKY